MTQNYTWEHFEKQNYSDIPVNIQEKVSMQDVIQAAAKDTVLSEHLPKNQSSYLGSNRRQSSVNLEAILKQKLSTTYNGTGSSTKSVLKKVVTIKASEKDRRMDQTLSK